jgi:para-aminobenzoate synthetase/4-amino-4-deoxychorismate lyase
MDSDSQEPPTASVPTPFLRFDFADTLGLPGPVCFSKPERVIVAHDVTEVVAALRAVEEAAREGLYAAGYVAYEAAPAFDDALVTRAPSSSHPPQPPAHPSQPPLVWFGLFRAPHPIIATVTSSGRNSLQSGLRPLRQADSQRRLRRRERNSASASPTSASVTSGMTHAVTASSPASPDASAPSWRWEPDITPEDYHAGIDAVKEAIARGDTYQVNYTFRLRSQIDVSSGADSPLNPGAAAPHRDLDLDRLYLRLAAAQRAPYSAYLDLGRWRVLSLSPELFFKVRGGRIVTKPMKGTAARGRWRDEDDERAAWLAASEKNRAENVMIVDLARNDVGRIAEIGSVRAVSLFEVERYPSVFQLVSTVEGTLRDRTTLTDVFTALFPAGSITGAPKSSSMRLIASIEHAPRGLYCGAIGFVAPSGDAIFNVAIRTAAIDTHTGRAEFGVGGGVTWDSTTDAEYAEALSKAACLAPPPAFELLETMRLEDGVTVRRDRHVQRMRESAAYFDVPFDADRINAALDAAIDTAIDGPVERAPAAVDAPIHVGTRASEGIDTESRTDTAAGARAAPRASHRVRLLLSQAGVPRVQSTPLASSSSGDVTSSTATPLLVVLASTPVSSQDVFLFHKTTNRAVYEAHARAIDRVAHPDAFDVLLWNDAREVTEFTIGNVIVEIDGERVTPPRRCGLLGGTFRAELLEQGAIRERVITLDDLSAATRLWLINSVRGEIEVRLVAG